MNLNKNIFKDNIITIIYALIIAIFIRSFFFQPFYIPSSSMEPNLLVGDRLFVSKYSYGYSKHSFPFSPNIFKGRIFFSEPKRGDVVVFKTPTDNRTDYIKRVIGLPGDKIFINQGNIIINDSIIFKEKIEDFIDINKSGNKKRKRQYKEHFFDLKINILDLLDNGPVDNTNVFIVPEDHFFVMGDNRDNSQDSRFLNSVGYIPIENLIGKAQYIFFSLENSRFFEIWKWPKAIRYNRIMKKI